MRVYSIIFGALPLLAVVYLCSDRLINSTNGPTVEQTSSVRKNVDALRTRQRANPKQLPRVTKEKMTSEVTQDSAQNDEESTADRAASAEAPDRTAELAATLDAEYETDGRQTRESDEREKAIASVFSKANLGESGALQDIQCREKLCRGTIVIASEQADREVFEKTVLSIDFQKIVPDAVSVASREKLADGSVVATFFIHPQSVFEAIAH